MIMKKDNFWKIFWSTIGMFLFLIVLMVSWLKFFYINAPENTNLAQAIGITFDPTKDPFSQNTQKRKFEPISGYLYRDSIPFGMEDWSWDTETNWRTKDGSNDTYVINTYFQKAFGGIRLNSPEFDVSKYKSISFDLKTNDDVDDLYIELHDKYGNSMGRQSIKWYTDDSLHLNTWSQVRIPLNNLINSGEKSITGFSISSKKEGSVSIDSIKLETSEVAHEKWVNTEINNEILYEWIGSNPFKDIEQDTLPLVTTFKKEEMAKWKTLFGIFEQKGNELLTGPEPKKTSGSMAVFGGGKNWTNYKADSVVYWGITSSLSLLARFQNDSNFVSCAYSNYGMIVQIYLVKNGESNLISQSPTLEITSYEPWKNVKHSIEVIDDEVSCYMDGKKVLKAQLPDMPKNGTVGFETWSKNSNDYPHKVLSLSVSSI